MEELENIKKQFDDLMAKAEEIVKKNEKVEEKDEEPKRWRAEKGETYWFANSRFEADWDYESELDTDLCRWKARNYFQTEEEAKKVAQHFEDYLILRGDTKGFEPDFSNHRQVKYYIRGSYNELYIHPITIASEGHIYFSSKKDAEASIEKHKDIWLRYLGVEK